MRNYSYALRITHYALRITHYALSNRPRYLHRLFQWQLGFQAVRDGPFGPGQHVAVNHASGDEAASILVEEFQHVRSAQPQSVLVAYLGLLQHGGLVNCLFAEAKRHTL